MYLLKKYINRSILYTRSTNLNKNLIKAKNSSIKTHFTRAFKNDLLEIGKFGSGDDLQERTVEEGAPVFCL